MPKILLMSDLHLEVSLFSPPPSLATADIVVLAGDIGTGMDGIEWAAQLGKPVVYVAGNHEYKGCDVATLETQWRAFQTLHPQVHFLQEGCAVIGGVRFLGCTLWSDFELFGYANKTFCMETAQRAMPEYKHTRNGQGMLVVNDTLALHHRQRQWLNVMLGMPFDGPTVVVTHHAPHLHSVAPQYRQSGLTAAFVSNLDSMLGRPVLWCHGHTHHRVDYWVDDTRIVSHPRGYQGAKDATPMSWDRHLVFEADVRGTRRSQRKPRIAIAS